MEYEPALQLMQAAVFTMHKNLQQVVCEMILFRV